MFGRNKIHTLEKELEDTKAASLRNAQIAAEREERIEQLESELRVLRFIGPKVFKVNAGDPDPTEETHRKGYVTHVALFFEDFLEKKLLHLISTVREDLDSPFGIDPSRARELPPGMTRAEYDWFLRGTTNAFKILLDWGDQMRNERAAYQQAEKDKSEN